MCMEMESLSANGRSVGSCRGDAGGCLWAKAGCRLDGACACPMLDVGNLDYALTNANIWIASGHWPARTHSLNACCSPAFLLSHSDGFLR